MRKLTNCDGYNIIVFVTTTTIAIEGVIWFVYYGTIRRDNVKILLKT